MIHILYSSFCRCSHCKSHWILSRKVKMPSCSNQTDLKTPDAVVTTYQLINVNFPGGLECTISILLSFCNDVRPTLQHDFSIQLGSSTITPSALVRNLGVIFDDQLTFKEHIAKTAQSCRFALHNIRKIRPFLTEYAAQLLVQALVISRLDYCNALLAGLPSNTIKPLQMIQNAAARLVFNEPKRAHVTPLFVFLHWLPVAACIQFKTLMLAYRTATGSVPTYFHSLMTIYIPSRSLRSASEQRLVVPSQRGSKSLSRTFSFTVPG